MTQARLPLFAAISLITIALALSIGNHTSRAAEHPAQQDSGLIVVPVREWYGMATDFDATVGGSVGHYAFQITCSGAPSTDVTITHDNPLFVLTWGVGHIECGSYYFVSFEFSPTYAGLTTDNVTFSSALGDATKELIGNGILEESPVNWVADLSPGNSAERLVYDGQRGYLYITDSAMNRVMVFSPQTRAVVTTIPVGARPVGLAMTPDRQKLFVANSGEYSVSVIDLNSQQQLHKISLSSMGPFPGYTPYDIAIVSDTLALMGSAPPGYASGGPIYQLDLISETASPRGDIGSGMYPVLRTSLNFSATVVLPEPGSSPSSVAWYNPSTNSVVSTGYGIERSLAINADGSKMVTTNHDCNILIPDLTLRNQSLTVLTRIQLLGCQALGVAFNPVSKNLVYATDGRDQFNIAEADTNGMRQRRSLRISPPYEYYQHDHRITISNDGQWAFMLLAQTWNAPPSKLLAMRIIPGDITAPVSALSSLASTQLRSWWLVSWDGSDDTSGIHHFDVQFRMGETGTWHNWLSTNATQGLFINATPGLTYYFRARAVDNMGNTESYPSDFETFTVAGSDAGGLSQSYLPLITK